MSDTPAPRSLEEIQQALTQATDRTPSTVVDAFLPGQVCAAGHALPPLTIQTWLFLEKIKSPFAQANPDAVPTLQQIMEAFYVIVMPVDGVEQTLALGPDAFQTAVSLFARTIPVRELGPIGAALAAHIAAEFAPRAELGRPDEGEDGDSPLPESLPAATEPAAS